MKTTEEMIEVMQAHLRGEKIEYRGQRSEYWGENKTPVWNWATFDYRIALHQRTAAEENGNEGGVDIEYEVITMDGEFCASSSDLSDARHYAAVYGQNGQSAMIIEVRRRALPVAEEKTP